MPDCRPAGAGAGEGGGDGVGEGEGEGEGEEGAGRAADARIYTSWQLLATGTGRVASRNPNVQQVPRASPEPAPGAASGGASEVRVCVRSAM